MFLRTRCDHCHSPTTTRFCSSNDLSSGNMVSLSMVMFMQFGSLRSVRLLRRLIILSFSILSSTSLRMQVGHWRVANLNGVRLVGNNQGVTMGLKLGGYEQS